MHECILQPSRLKSFWWEKWLKEGKNSISHIKRWGVLGGFPLRCVHTSKNGGWELKGGRGEEGVEKGNGVREKRDERMMERGKRSEGEVSRQTHMTCSHSPQPVMSSLMTVTRLIYHASARTWVCARSHWLTAARQHILQATLEKSVTARWLIPTCLVV